ncbi:DNA-binding protein [Microcystis sp. M061S2]|uniref:DNA-binding protein n=1 Tax=Microcystis sp. M061S2 TaxID=2771171 RepID=UPI0025877041|nr:DNA-binding protein [Microcystis sp. M061S2]MCA2653031.1 hypothetical protein [Microcystis sp. M061S2]
MARDKLITIRIEGEKREAFNNLAKSQNTDTASLLYDFISGCLDGTLDISLVTGKKQWIDKIDNQLDTNRLDKLEATTQRIDNRLDTISKKLTDWIEAFDDRLTDSDQGLSDKITSLEHRLNALAIQLDSQEIDSIDTDSQQIGDMEPLLKREREASIAAPIPTGETSPGSSDQPAIETVTPEVSPSPPSPALEAIASIDGTVETVEPISAINEPVTDAIGTVTDSKPWYTIDDLLDCHYSGWPKTKEGLRKKALTEGWPRRTQRGSKGNPYEYQAVLPE